MNLSNWRYNFFPLALLFLVAIGAIAFVPAALHNHIVGYNGKVRDGQMVVIKLLPGTPAELAGLQTGDIITHIDGVPALEHHKNFKRDFSGFLDTLYSWRDRPVPYTLDRQGTTLETEISSRPVTVGELGSLFGVRILFCIFLLGLTMVILLSGTRSPETTLFVCCYLLTIAWLLFEARYWPVFGAPLIPDTQYALFKAQVAVSIAAVQLDVGCVLLIALRFPRIRKVLVDHPRWGIGVVVAPLLLTLLTLLVIGGVFFEMVKHAYTVRLWLNSGLLACALLLLIDNYRSCDSALQKEQSRWLIYSFAVAVFAIVGLWNIPILLIQSPIVPGYDWLLAPIALFPLAMTLSINNHRLFGIRSILGYRQKIVEARLARERSHVRQRDHRIRSLVDELDRLKSELSEYNVLEGFGIRGRGLPQGKILELEQKFPELHQIREERLLGNSPAWVDVFENIALATYGTAPVLICGESGTGKTDVARTIHQLGDRNASVYREISCAQFEHADPAIALGRLFGIGTGHGLANVPREGQTGLLEECDGGTLFLDDFDCLPMNVQNLLLYPLEGKAFEPGIGKGQPAKVSVKFILATNRDPHELVEFGKLRGDLLARLGSRVDIPPLRKRKEDIDVLVSHFTEELAYEMDYKITGISERAHQLLNQEDYRKGNARQLNTELRHAIGKAMLQGDSVLRAAYLSEGLTGQPTVERAPIESVEPPTTTESEKSPLPDKATKKEDDNELAVLRRHRFRIAPSEEELGLSHKSKTLSNHLRGLCIQAMRDNQWNISEAARSIAGTDDRVLIKKIEAKIRRYWKNIENRVDSGEEGKLFNNLPARYHPALTDTIYRFNSDS